MKILHIITSIDKGGAENHVVSLIEAQRKKNNSIGIFYSKKGSYWKTYLKSLGVFVNQPYFINEKFFFLRLIKFFFDLIQLCNFLVDLIFVFFVFLLDFLQLTPQFFLTCDNTR